MSIKEEIEIDEEELTIEFLRNFLEIAVDEEWDNEESEFVVFYRLKDFPSLQFTVSVVDTEALSSKHKVH